jgi:hypothetical protein
MYYKKAKLSVRKDRLMKFAILYVGGVVKESGVSIFMANIEITGLAT